MKPFPIAFIVTTFSTGITVGVTATITGVTPSATGVTASATGVTTTSTGLAATTLNNVSSAADVSYIEDPNVFCI